jgi:hypothetical protein
MTYHCDKLCSGECCAPLRFAIRAHEQSDYLACDTYAQDEAYRATDDPAKLAELMAMALLARGVELLGIAFCVVDGSIVVVASKWRRVRTMPQARAALLTIMALPADASSKPQCERIVRGDQ